MHQIQVSGRVRTHRIISSSVRKITIYDTKFHKMIIRWDNKSIVSSTELYIDTTNSASNASYSHNLLFLNRTRQPGYFWWNVIVSAIVNTKLSYSHIAT